MAEIKSGIFAKNVQKRINRAQEKVLQKLGKADETKDEQFEQVVINFRRQESEGSRLQREMKNYMTAIKGMQQASINLTQSLHEVYEPDWHGKDDVVLIGKDCDALWEDFHNKIVDSTLLNLDAYLTQFPDLKTRVSKRSRKLIDYDSARHHVETLQAQGLKSDRKMIKAEEELKKAERVFEDLNVGLQDELPTLWDSRVQFYIDTFKSVTTLETKFHKEISLVCRQLYEIMTKLAEQHPDKMFNIQGAPSDSGPLRLARTPSPPEDDSPPDSPEVNHLRPVSPMPPRPKSPCQARGPPVPPPPKVSPPKEEQIIDLFGGEFLPAPSPSQPNDRPGESLLDLDLDSFQLDENVAPIPQTAVPWDMWAGDQQQDQQNFVCSWAAFSSDQNQDQKQDQKLDQNLDQNQDQKAEQNQDPGPQQIPNQNQDLDPGLDFGNLGRESTPDPDRLLRPPSPEGSGSDYETAEEGPDHRPDHRPEPELDDRHEPEPNQFGDHQDLSVDFERAPNLAQATDLGLGSDPNPVVDQVSFDSMLVSGFSSGFDSDPFAETQPGFGPDPFSFGADFGMVPGLDLGPTESGHNLQSDEDEVTNQRLGSMYQDQDQSANAFNGFSSEGGASSFFADFDKMNQATPTAEGEGPKDDVDMSTPGEKAKAEQQPIETQETEPMEEQPSRDLSQVPEPDQDPEPEPDQDLEQETDRDLEPEPVLDLEPEPGLDLEPEQGLDLEPEPDREPALEPDREPALEPDREPELESDREPVLEPELEPDQETMAIPSVVIEPASSNEGDDDRDADIISPTVAAGNDSAPIVQHIGPSDGTLPQDFLYKVETMHDFEAANSDELELKRGDVVLVVPTLSQEDQEAGWLTGIKLSDWSALGVSAHRGLFPENFIQRLN